MQKKANHIRHREMHRIRHLSVQMRISISHIDVVCALHHKALKAIACILDQWTLVNLYFAEQRPFV